MPLNNTRIVRIEWGDCDPAGIIFYPRYFEIFDAATSALFEHALGLTKLELVRTYDIVGFPLARTRAKFIKPTRFGDDVTVETSIKFGRTSFAIEHRLSLKGEVCVEAEETRVWAARDGASGGITPQPVPDEVREKFGV
jgi:4-hydroxybenzoyl-CoA thioesterase